MYSTATVFGVSIGAMGERLTVRASPGITWPGKSIRLGSEERGTDRELARLCYIEATQLRDALTAAIEAVKDAEKNSKTPHTD